MGMCHMLKSLTWVNLTLMVLTASFRLITMCPSTTQSERAYCRSEMNLRYEANVHVTPLGGSLVSSGDITQTLACAVIAFLSFKKSLFRHEASTFRCCYRNKTKCMSEMGFSNMLIVKVFVFASVEIFRPTFNFLFFVLSCFLSLLLFCKVFW